MRLPTWCTPTRVALITIVVGAALLRLTHIGSLPPGLYPDEATNGNDALRALSGGWDWFYPANGGREALFINLQAVSLALAGVREAWALRIVSALVGIATIPGMYLLGRELWNRRVGLLAAGLLAGSFWHLVFSRIGFRAIMAPLFLTYALYALVAGVRRLRSAHQHGWTLTLLSGALAGLGLHTYIAFRMASLVFIATGFALIAESGRGERKRVLAGIAAAGGTALLVASPLLMYFETHPGSFSGRASEVSVFAAEHPFTQVAKNTLQEVGMLVVRGDGNWRHNDAGVPAIPLAIFTFVCIGATWSAVRLMRNRGRDVPGVMLAALLIASALPAVLSNEGLPHALRSIMGLVPVFLLAAVGLEYAARKLERHDFGRLVPAFLVAIILGSSVLTAVRYAQYVRKPEVRAEFTTSYVEIGRALLARDKGIPAYVVVPNGSVTIDGVPVSAQTTMFISGTATKEAQEREQVFYVTNRANIPEGAATYVMQ